MSDQLQHSFLFDTARTKAKNFAAMFTGISFSVVETDENTYIIATGKTYENRARLKIHGFTWNGKTWARLIKMCDVNTIKPNYYWLQ